MAWQIAAGDVLRIQVCLAEARQGRQGSETVSSRSLRRCSGHALDEIVDVYASQGLCGRAA